MKFIPKLKKKYQTEDFIIISYSLDTSFDSWKQASINGRINWINISDLKGYKSETVINYNIRGVPMSFIIDKNGIIGNLNIGFHDDTDSIEKELNKLF